MADEEGYKLDTPSLRRIDKTIRKVSEGIRTGGSPGPNVTYPETALGRLTTKVAGGWQ